MKPRSVLLFIILLRSIDARQVSFRAKMPPSPLDNSDEKFDDDDIEDLPECQRDCARDLAETFQHAFEAENHIQRFELLCKKYNDAWECIENADCGSSEMFATLTHGIHYMCMEQPEAFNATIECIDAAAAEVRRECETTCNTQAVMASWVMRGISRLGYGDGGFRALFGGGMRDMMDYDVVEKGPLDFDHSLHPGNQRLPLPAQPQGSIDQSEVKNIFGEACGVAECMLACIRNKFNTRCHGSAGTLLAEVFIRPVARGQEQLGFMRSVFNLVMPDTCDVFYDGQKINQYRIDRNLHNELKRMYTAKAEEEAKMRAMKDVPDVLNPMLDDDDLDDMIRRRYGKHRTADLAIQTGGNQTQDGSGNDRDDSKMTLMNNDGVSEELSADENPTLRSLEGSGEERVDSEEEEETSGEESEEFESRTLRGESSGMVDEELITDEDFRAVEGSGEESIEISESEESRVKNTHTLRFEEGSGEESMSENDFEESEESLVMRVTDEGEEKVTEGSSIEERADWSAEESGEEVEDRVVEGSGEEGENERERTLEDVLKSDPSMRVFEGSGDEEAFIIYRRKIRANQPLTFHVRPHRNATLMCRVIRNP